MTPYNSILPSGGDTGAPINRERRIRLIRRYLDLRHKSILDCGCETGAYVLKFLEFSSDVHGIEYYEDKVRTFKTLNHNSDAVHQGNIEKLDFKDSRFDLVF